MRVLILYPGLYEERRDLLAPHKWRLRLTGTKFILAEDRLHPEDGAVFGETLQLPSPEKAGEVWEELSKYLKRHPVDAIVAQSEPALLIGARAAREFGLIGPSVEAAMATVNKFGTRTQLKAAGIPQPDFRLVSCAAEVRAFAEEHGWPVILKATASSRQRLVTRVAGREEVESAVEHMLASLPTARDVIRMASFAELEGLDLGFDPFKQFLVERSVDGVALECDGVISGSTADWVGVCEQVPAPIPGYFIEGYLLPTRESGEQQHVANGIAQACVQTLGLTNTGVSVEIHMSDQQPYVIEVNGRLPWDEGMQELVQAATGCFPALLALRVAMGKSIRRARIKRHAALLYCANYLEGTVESVPEPSEFKRLTRGAHAAWLFAQPGMEVLQGVHPDSRPHLAGVLTTDRHSTARAMQRGQAILDGLSIRIVEASHSLPPGPQPEES